MGVKREGGKVVWGKGKFAPTAYGNEGKHTDPNQDVDSRDFAGKIR